MVSLFGPGYNPKPASSIALSKVVEVIRAPDVLQNETELARSAYQAALKIHGNHTGAHSDAAYKAEKQKVPGFTSSGDFRHRGNDHLIHYSGLLSYDLDGLGHDDVVRIKAAARSDSFCVMAYTSPSGHGVKLFLRWAGPCPEGHKRAWDTGRQHVESVYGVTVTDKAGQDLSRLCLLAYDPEVHFNPDAVPLTVPAEPVHEPPINNAPEPVPVSDEEEQIRSALGYLDPDAKYDDWTRVGMALRHWNAERGFIFWDHWSSLGAKYRKNEMRGKWESFAAEHDKPVTLGTLFHLASERGWTRIATPDVLAGEPDEWPDLDDIDAIPLPEFPLDGFPADFREMCEAVAETSKVPVELPAGLAMAVAAACSAKAFQVAVGDTHVEPVNLYCVTLMDTGERKSTVFKEMRTPIDLIEAETAEAQKVAIAEAISLRKTREAKITDMRRKAARARPPEMGKYERDIREMEATLPVVPAQCQITCGDVTPEHIAQLMARQGGRIAQFDPECGSLVNMLNGQYSKDGASTCDIYLKAYSGDPIRVGRVSRETVDLGSPALTMAVTGQPAHIRQIKDIGMLRDRGLLGRILWLMPPSRVGTRTYSGGRIDERIRAAYRQRVRAMYRGVMNPPVTLAIGGEALAYWTSYYNKTEKELKPGGALRDMRDWAGRRAGHVARIAGILHLMAGKEGGDIGPDTVASAVDMIEVFTQHARRVYRHIDSSPKTLLGAIVAWIREQGQAMFSSNELYKALRSWRTAGVLKSNADLRPSLDELARRNYIRAICRQHAGVGRPPAGSYEVNPKVVVPFSGNSGGSI
jgi:hypothetical protein